MLYPQRSLHDYAANSEKALKCRGATVQAEDTSPTWLTSDRPAPFTAMDAQARESANKSPSLVEFGATIRATLVNIGHFLPYRCCLARLKLFSENTVSEFQLMH